MSCVGLEWYMRQVFQFWDLWSYYENVIVVIRSPPFFHVIIKSTQIYFHFKQHICVYRSIVLYLLYCLPRLQGASHCGNDKLSALRQNVMIYELKTKMPSKYAKETVDRQTKYVEWQQISGLPQSTKWESIHLGTQLWLDIFVVATMTKCMVMGAGSYQ